MRNNNRSNVLLVEILIAVLFFMLSATVLVRVFVTARNMTVRSGVESRALAEAQNVADTLYAAEDTEAWLSEQGYVLSHGAWSKDYGEYSLYIEAETENTQAGELWKGRVSAFYRHRNTGDARPTDEELFTLPCTRYKGAEQ